MSQMVIGTTLFKLDGSAYYSLPFARGGLAAVFSAQVSHLEGGPTFKITVEHRNAEDTSFATAGTFSNITSVGVESQAIGDLKQILRFKYEFDAGDASTDGVHFAMLMPSWRPYP